MKYIFSIMLMAFVAVNMNAQTCCSGKEKTAKTEQCSGDKAKKAACCSAEGKTNAKATKTAAVKKENKVEGPKLQSNTTGIQPATKASARKE